MKLNIVFDAIGQVEWDVPKFLAQLFQKEKVDERHERVVKAMLNDSLFIDDALEIRSCACYM